MKKNYELIEHTADIGIRVKAKDLKGLFKTAALAMFDIIAEKKVSAIPACPAGGSYPCLSGRQELSAKKFIVKQKADDLEELFINWLNELLSLSATKEMIFSGFRINRLEENTLQAVATGNDIKNYKVNTEIKAATYHELKIEQAKSGWQVEVIFDV